MALTLRITPISCLMRLFGVMYVQFKLLIDFYTNVKPWQSIILKQSWEIAMLKNMNYCFMQKGDI